MTHIIKRNNRIAFSESDLYDLEVEEMSIYMKNMNRIYIKHMKLGIKSIVSIEYSISCKDTTIRRYKTTFLFRLDSTHMFLKAEDITSIEIIDKEMNKRTLIF